MGRVAGAPFSYKGFAEEMEALAGRCGGGGDAEALRGIAWLARRGGGDASDIGRRPKGKRDGAFGRLLRRASEGLDTLCGLGRE